MTQVLKRLMQVFASKVICLPVLLHFIEETDQDLALLHVERLVVIWVGECSSTLLSLLALLTLSFLGRHLSSYYSLNKLKFKFNYRTQ